MAARDTGQPGGAAEVRTSRTLTWARSCAGREGGKEKAWGAARALRRGAACGGQTVSVPRATRSLGRGTGNFAAQRREMVGVETGNRTRRYTWVWFAVSTTQLSLYVGGSAHISAGSRRGCTT